MKILNSEIIMEIFNNIKEAYPNAEKIWYDSKEEKIFYKIDGTIQEINLRDLVHNDIKLASLIFEDLKDKAGTYYNEYIGTSMYEEKSYLKDDYEFLAKYIKLGLLFTYFIDEMLSGYDYMELEDKYKSLEIDGTVCFEEGAYKFLKKILEERKRVHDLLRGGEIMSAELRSLDDYVDTPKGLESLAKVLIKSRLATMPKNYVFSTAWNKNDFLSGFTKMQPILTKHEDCTIIYLGTYYKPMKMRKRRNRTWNTQN